MQVLANLSCQFTLDDLWQNENGGRTPSPTLLRMGEELHLEAQDLIDPAAIFDLIPVNKVTHDRIHLPDGNSLRGHDIAKFLAPATQLFSAVVTIGPELEAQASRYSTAGEKARGYLLDSIGTVALTNLVQQVCSYLEGTMAESGVPVGFPISPGDSGWPLAEQRVLFNLLPVERIGVALNQSCVMVPKKSVSFVIGVGHGIRTASEASQCDFCSVRDTCRYRERYQKNAGADSNGQK